MFRAPLWSALVALTMMSFSCMCDRPPAGLDGGVDGGRRPGVGGRSGTAGQGGAFDAGLIVDPNDPNNELKDSDCDGLTDAEEFGNTYPGGQRTNPAVADTDGDGIKDGVEAGRLMSVDSTCGYVGDADPMSRTNPTVVDSDGDGLPDGLEDGNLNGRAEPTETNAANPDTDLDGLSDGEEDANRNGQVDPGETSPRLRDTDMDRIADGAERRVTMTDPTLADTDGDTCGDGVEDANQNGRVDMGETNPRLSSDCGAAINPDTDGDGIPNRLEDSNGNGRVDPGETDPANPDSDGDGLRDGIEDANRNGRLESGETNPLRKDSDCDGLLDGPTASAIMGEDENANGSLDMGETDPRRRDTDADGISDGVERGVTAARLADAAGCPNVPVDADPTTTTNPNARDTDGDGIDDGAEDANQNGRVDPGELNPRDPSDGVGPAAQVCTAMNLRPVLFRGQGEPDLQLGIPNSFTEVITVASGGSPRGIMGFDPSNNVAFVAWRQAAPTSATTPTQDEAALAPRLAAIGALTNPTTQTFTSWDGVPALQAFYDMAGTVDLKSRVNAIANTLIGTGAGAFAGVGGPVGPFKLEVEYLHRSDAAVVVIVAITPLANFAGAPLFVMSDTAGGSGVAQFGDTTAIQCEPFRPAGGKVDFLFVVDDSCSMGASQGALSLAAQEMANALNNSQLDWRAALVTSSYHLSGNGPNQAVLRSFTTNLATFRSWLTPVAGCDVTRSQCNASCAAVADGWVGLCGSGDEGVLGAARKAVNDLANGVPPDGGVLPNRFRAGAEVAVVLLGDADDQTTAYSATSKCLRDNPESCESIANYVSFFRGVGGMGQERSNPLGRPIAVHGIVCPQGPDRQNGTNGIQTCNGEDQSSNQRHAQIVTATGGVRGAIDSNASISAASNQIVASTINAAGYRMLKPPIGASVKVAMDVVQTPAMCSANDIPRSRANGFDFDGLNRTITFFGACRPTSGTMRAAVSYRYWNDNTPNTGGNRPPCSNDPFFDPTDVDFCRGRLACNVANNSCECPSDCGGGVAPPGKTCDTNRLVCDFVCTADCGGTCSQYQQCNVATCGCECRQMASCPVGYQFQNSAGVCGCVCDTAALNCGATYQADANACACVCKPNCGGCASGQTCNPSTCSCSGGIN